jgi:hypothetical protein
MFSRIIAFSLAAAALLPGQSAVAADDHGMNDPRGCPGHFCRNYVIDCTARPGVSCGRVSSAPVRIEYWLNPANIWGFPPEELARWFEYAARTWEYANPRLRFKRLGFTTDLAVPNDGKNVVAFQLIVAPTPAAGAVFFSQAGSEEWDMWMNIYHEPVWLPCRFDCTPVPAQYWGGLEHPLEDRELKTLTRLEIAGVIVHEFGHVLGLHHPKIIDDVYPTCVTMFVEGGQCDPDAIRDQQYPRHLQSPALAELLGLRELYPYRCPKAPKGVKDGDRSWMNWCYQRVCPTINVAIP